MPYRVLDHTADAGVEATEPTFPGLVEELAAGMFALIAEVEPCSPEVEASVAVESESREDLVVDVLSELLFRSEVEDVVFCEFEASETGGGGVTVTARGVPSRALPLTGAPVKAVTYHDLIVAPRAEGWYGRVYFDV